MDNRELPNPKTHYLDEYQHDILDPSDVKSVDGPSVPPPPYEATSSTPYVPANQHGYIPDASAPPAFTSPSEFDPLPYSPSNYGAAAAGYGGYNASHNPHNVYLQPKRGSGRRVRRRTGCCHFGSCCKRTSIVILMMLVIFKLVGKFKFNYGGNGIKWSCLGSGHLWPNSTTYRFDAQRYSSLNIAVEGAVTLGSTEIILSDEEYGTVDVEVYTSLPRMFDDIHSRLELGQTFLYHILLPDSLGSECIKVNYKISLPSKWRNADKLYVNVNNMNIDVRDNITNIGFSSVDLRTSNAPIKLSHIRSQSLNLKTKNADINGVVSTIGSLAVETTNGKISLQSLTKSVSSVSLITTNGDITGSYYASTIVACTTNGNIQMEWVQANKVSLKTSNGYIKGSNYIVDKSFEASTTNQQIDVHIRFPDNNSLDLKRNFRASLESTNNKASLYLPLPYEGSFYLSTSHGRAIIQPENALKDVVYYTDTTAQKVGYKGDITQDNGVIIKSSNGDVILSFYDL